MVTRRERLAISFRRAGDSATASFRLVPFAAVLLGLIPGVAAQEGERRRATNEEMEAMCRKVLCRPPVPIRLKLADGKTFEMTQPMATPVVSGDWVTVLPGETVMVEATLVPEGLTELRAVRTVIHKERTLVFTFKQEPSIGDGTGMVLSVTSPFPGAIKYRLGMMLPENGRILKTSACPLKSGVTSFEHWPHPIYQIVAADFRIVDAASEAAQTCE